MSHVLLLGVVPITYVQGSERKRAASGAEMGVVVQHDRIVVVDFADEPMCVVLRVSHDQYVLLC